VDVGDAGVDRAAVRARLTQERDALGAMGRDLAASFEDIVGAAKDSNLDDEHDPEGSTIAAERSLVASLGRSAAEALIEIEQALARLDDGTYGVCLRCGAAISPGRLDARPAAALCITCAGRPR